MFILCFVTLSRAIHLNSKNLVSKVQTALVFFGQFIIKKRAKRFEFIFLLFNYQSSFVEHQIFEMKLRNHSHVTP